MTMRQEPPKIRSQSSPNSSKAFPPCTMCSKSNQLRHTPHEREQFKILKTLYASPSSKIFLAKSHKKTLVLKCLPADSLASLELVRSLPHHPKIISNLREAPFSLPLLPKWSVHPMEYAENRDLGKFTFGGRTLPQEAAKAVAAQLTAALEFLHGEGLVHRNVVSENVLIFKEDFSLIKLGGFGCMVRMRALLTRGEDGGPGLPHLPPEVAGMLPCEKYHSYPSVDVWQLGILLTSTLSGKLPWKLADPLRDGSYGHWVDWVKRRRMKAPPTFLPFTPRLLRLLKRMLEANPIKRCGIREVNKYLEDVWTVQGKKDNKNNPSSAAAAIVPRSGRAHKNMIPQ